MTAVNATVTRGGYRCRCGSDQPSVVLSLIPFSDVCELPEFKLRMPVAADSASSSSGVEKTTLCGYVVCNSIGFSLWHSHRPARLYRLIYRRREKNVSGGPLPPASAQLPNDDYVDAEREERRLMATEEGRRRYGNGVRGY